MAVYCLIMRPIYIERGRSSNNKNKYVMAILFAIAIVIFVAALVAPYFLQSYINRRGSDDKGYSYRISGLDINYLKKEILIKDIRIFNQKNGNKIAELANLSSEVNPASLLKGEFNISINTEEAFLLLSDDFAEEINRVASDTHEKTKAREYNITFAASKLLFQKVTNDNITTLIVLKSAEGRLSKKESEEKASFSLNSTIDEGGKLKLDSIWALNQPQKNWIINGEFNLISPHVIEKMAGNELPFVIVDSKINATIKAESANGKIEGVITPTIKNLKLAAEKDDGLIKRSIAKATNTLIKKSKEDKKALVFEIPFVLSNNLTLDFSETLTNMKSLEQ
jgi:hypothetical protein